MLFVGGATSSALLWVLVTSGISAQEVNHIPEFREGDSAIRIVMEGTGANQNIGEPVGAVDLGDTLIYSLAGDDAGHFDIDSGNGQLLTKGSLDYETEGSYSVVVEVTDGVDDAGEPDTGIDDTIAITIRVSVSVDLNDWTAEDYDSSTQYCASGSWTVDADGKAKETGGEAPSILHGDFAAYGKRLTAKVNPGSDDDFFGFVVGFNGGDPTNSSANYLLIDWKKQRQDWDFSGDSTSPGGNAEAGLRLSRVIGIPDCDEFWQHANLSGTDDSNGLEELLEADTKGSTGYNRQEYEFVIDFGSESIEVYLDGRLELDLDGEFSDGKFGAYAMLHNSAVFWDFSYTDGGFPSSSELVDQAGEVILSSAVSEVGVSITATLTDPDGGVTNQVWQWESSPDQDPPTWTEITDTDSSNYTPADSDAGKLLRVRVTYDDSLGAGKTATSASTSPADRLGSLTLSPTSPIAGEEVQTALADADGGITNQMWAWESSPDANPPTWSTISGATSAAHTPTGEHAGRILRARVTYDDAAGTGRTAVSAATSAVDQRGGVTLSPNVPVAGEAVVATLADPDGDVTSEVWKWERSPGTGEPVWSTISGADSSSYTPISSDDAGKRLRVMVSYSDSTGTGRSATSGASDRVDQRGVVRLSSTVPDVGIEVAATLRDADGGVTGEAWQWQKSSSTGAPSWSDISDADEDTYTPVTGDEGMVLRAVVDYDDAVGSERSEDSDATKKVGKPGTTSLDDAMPVVGEKLTATLTDGDGMVTNESWQWESSAVGAELGWSEISGATSASYTPQATDAGWVLRAVATYTDGSGDGRVARSASTASVDQVGSVTLSPDPPVVGKPARAALVDHDGSVTNQVWKWERSPHGSEEDREWTVITGAGTNSYKPTGDEDSGKLLRVTVSYDDGTGTGRSATSGATKRVDREGVVMVWPLPPVAAQVVTATLSDGDGSVVNQVWKWERSVRTGTPEWTEVTGAASHTYTPLASADGGMRLRATVTYDDAVGTNKTAVSPSTLPVDRLGIVGVSTSMPVAGEVVTAMLTDGDGGVLNEEWQWESSPDQETPSWTEIAGAEGLSYTPSASLAGNLLRATVEYDDATGRDREAASDATEALDQRGSVSVAPTDPVVGEALKATLTDADGSITNRSWAWERSADQEDPEWSVIGDAEAATYTPQTGDAGKVLRVRVAYDDGTGMGRTAVSEATMPVDRRGGVVLSQRTPVIGEAVTATLNDPDGDITNGVWKWERSPGEGDPAWTTITGAASSSYTPEAPVDVGRILRAMVTYKDGTGSGKNATSDATNRVDQPGALTVSTGVPDVGTVVMGVLADADGGVTGEIWQWQTSPSTGTPAWSDITDTDEANYSPVSTDEGLLLRAMVSYDDAIGTGRTAISAHTQKVGKAGVVSLDSTMPVVGGSLTATLTDGDGSVSNEEWHWESGTTQEDPVWSGISGADSSSYTPETSDAGKLLRVGVTYTDGSGSSRVAMSQGTGRVDQRGTVSVSPNPPVVGKQTRATLMDADGSISNEAWTWEKSPGTGDPEWTTISGAQSSSYTPTAADDSGRLLRVSVVYDDGTGVGRSATSDATKRVDQEGVVALSPSLPVAGQSVTATLTDADGSVSNEVWTWKRSVRIGTPVWEVISGATGASYTPTASDDGGKILRAAVAYDDGIGTGRVAGSASTLPVDRLGVVSLSTSIPVVGEAVTATLTDDDGGVLNGQWQWESFPDQEELSWGVITGAEASSYTPPASLAGKVLRVVVRYDDTTGRGRAAASEATEPLDQRGIVTFSSSTPVVGRKLTATISDSDGGITNEAWLWESSSDADPRVWSAIANIDSATYTPMPADAGRILRAVAIYDDATGTSRRAISEAIGPVRGRVSAAEPVGAGATTPLVVSRYNVPPVFEEGTETQREIALGWSGAKAGNPVNATDDSRESLSYLLTGQDSMFFEVNPATGQVRIDERLVFLSPGVYLVTLHAIDSKGGFASIELSIRVLQFSVPVFSEGDGAIREVMENLAVGALVGPPVRAKDRDGDTVTYSLGGGYGAAFQVDAGSGQIRTRAILDREKQETYALILRAEDGRGGQDVIEVEIQVGDQNEPPTLDNMSRTDFTVAENSAPGAVVGGPFAAQDPEGDLLEYSLFGDDGDSLAITSSTGQLLIKGVLDYEKRSDYQLIVRVQDGRGGIDEIDVRVEVVDVNEAPILGSRGVVEFVVSEDLPEGGAMGEALIAKDPEGDRLTYSLSGDGSITFDVDAHSGLMMSRGPLDFESRSSYLVKVSVVDVMGGSDSVYVHIRVADVEEEAPGPNEERDTETAIDATDLHPSWEVPPTLSLAEKGPDQHEDPAFEPGTEGVAIDASHEASSPVRSGAQSATVGTVADEPVATPPFREVVEQSEYGMDAGDDAEIETLEVSFVNGPNASLEANTGSFTGSSPDRLPLWVALVLLALSYIDGILLLAASYRLWGRPVGRRRWASTYNAG